MKYINKDKYSKYIIIISGIIFVILLWFLISLLTNKSLFPDPLSTFKQFFVMLGEGATWLAIGGTLLRLLISFAISFASALILGIIAGLYHKIYIFLQPLIIILRTLPTAAIIYVIIVLLKPVAALFIIVNLLMFPIMYEAIASGIANIDQSIMDACRIEMNPSNPKAVFKVLLPSIKNNIVLGIIQSIGLGMKVSIMAEVLCGSDKIAGLGRIIYHAYNDADMLSVFAVSLIAIVLIGLSDLSLHYFKKKIK